MGKIGAKLRNCCFSRKPSITVK